MPTTFCVEGGGGGLKKNLACQNSIGPPKKYVQKIHNLDLEKFGIEKPKYQILCLNFFQT